MAYIPRSSFVPKEVSSAIPVQIKQKHTIRVFSLIGTTMLFLSALGSVGVYFYKGFLDDELKGLQASLSEMNNEEDQRKVEEIESYDRELKIASQLLENHIAPSKIFEQLEMLTKETVQFQDLKFSYDPGFDAVLEVKGVTDKFASIALQEMEIEEQNPFSDFVVRDINSGKSADATGASSLKQEVSFSIKGLFKDKILQYLGTEAVQKSVPDSVQEVPRKAATTTSGADNTSSETL